MEFDQKRRVLIPFWILCALFSFSGLGWLTASFFVGKIPDGELRNA